MKSEAYYCGKCSSPVDSLNGTCKKCGTTYKNPVVIPIRIMKAAKRFAEKECALRGKKKGTLGYTRCFEAAFQRYYKEAYEHSFTAPRA